MRSIDIEKSPSHDSTGDKSQAKSWSYKRIGNIRAIITKDDVVCVAIGPHWPGVIATIGMIFGGAVVNLHVLGKSHFPFSNVMPYLIAVMFILSLFFLLMTACTDPGILRLKSQQDSECLLEENNKRVHFCDVCNISQPVGAAHCEYCDCCIDRLDHHCPWMGKCIGRKNMFWFKCFIAIVCIYMTQLIILALNV